MCRWCGVNCVGPCYDYCMCRHCWYGWEGLSIWTKIWSRLMAIVNGEKEMFQKIELDRSRDKDRSPSRAVIAQLKGRGAVLWYDGPDISMEIEEHGISDLGDLGLDSAPDGISIWEGYYRWSPGPYEHSEDGEYYPIGEFRSPISTEWARIQRNLPPWWGGEYR